MNLPVAAPDEMIGRTVGAYRLVRLLGVGGMGTVYEAVHAQIGGRAAVKMLHPEYARRPEFADRFFNEACANNVVQHAGIVSVYEYGKTDDGRPFIVMEYLDGEPLSDRLDRSGPLGAASLRIARQIASALAAAHNKGIIHRDMKPDNVMLVPDHETPGGERIKILDFGIAKLAEEYTGPRASGRATATGAAMGTAVYMSPEQCRSSAHVDPKCDVYALGVMLYEMLAGQPPFKADGAGHIMGMHIYEQPPPLQDVAPSTPFDTVALVHRMLVKEPAERPSMREVITSLEALGAPTVSGALIIPSHTRPAGQRRNPTTTLGRGVGETRPRGEQTRLAFWSLGLGSLVALGGVVGYIAPRSQAVRVHLAIQSVPSGARVFRVEDGVLIGQTPLSQEHVAGAGRLRVVLRLPGYQAREVALPLNMNSEVREVLELKRPAVLPTVPEVAETSRPSAPEVLSVPLKKSRGKPRPPGRPDQSVKLIVTPRAEPSAPPIHAPQPEAPVRPIVKDWAENKQ